MNSTEYQRLSYLGDRVKANSANKKEKDEFMFMLFNNGSITQQQYNDYISGNNADNLINTALTIGAVVLLGYLLNELLNKK